MGLRILVADDHGVLRLGIKSLLLSHEGWEVCGEAQTGLEAVDKSKQLRPDVAILDFSMPGMDGLEAARRIRKVLPDTEILILSMHYSDQLVRAIVDEGIRGYLMKSNSDRDLIIAVEALANHKPFFNSDAAGLILSRFNGSAAKVIPDSIPAGLTSREREIVKLFVEGGTSRQVALSLGITAKKAEILRMSIMRKLQIHNVSGLVRYAVRNQIIEA